MGALRPLLLVVLLLAPTLIAQPVPDPTVVGETADEAYRTVAPEAENQTGEDVTSEEIDLTIDLDVRAAEFDLLGVLFGGGKAETTMRAQILLAFRAISIDRLEPALQEATGDANVSVTRMFGLDTNRTVLTAEEVRAAGGGLLLEAFQSYQEDATAERLERTVPGVTVISSRFDWANTVPGERPREGQDPSLREPPLVLDARIEMRFIDHYSLADLVPTGDGRDNRTADDGNETTGDGHQTDQDLSPQRARANHMDDEDLRQRIEENQTLPFAERSAFQVLGIGQLLSVEIPSGWRVNLTVTVPQGFVVAGATEALSVTQDRQTATYFLDSSDRSDDLATSGVVTLSDRSLVTFTLVALTFLVGLVLRIPIELGASWWRRR